MRPIVGPKQYYLVLQPPPPPQQPTKQNAIFSPESKVHPKPRAKQFSTATMMNRKKYSLLVLTGHNMGKLIKDHLTRCSITGLEKI